MEEAGASPPPASFRPPQQLHLKQQRGSGKRCFLSGSSHLSSTMKLSCANLSSRSPPAASMGLVVAPDCGGLDVASPAPPFLSGSTEPPFGPKTQQMHVSAPPASRRSEEVQEVTCREPRLRGWNTLRRNSCSFAGVQASPRRHAQLDQRLLLLRWCLDASSSLLMRPAFRSGCPRSRRSAEMLSGMDECSRAVLPRARGVEGGGGGLIRRREPEWD